MEKLIPSLLLSIVLQGCQVMSWLPEDNAIEEYIEEMIKDKTGIAVDFTGDSEEG